MIDGCIYITQVNINLEVKRGYTASPNEEKTFMIDTYQSKQTSGKLMRGYTASPTGKNRD